ncbi:hypothetical protein BRC65_09435 [Halobacteriales archaeon QH_2_65_14]|nr:MAG: hypothetical protein BRC65_09435 [Halobacteriales archaeon QH_2_65_14]
MADHDRIVVAAFVLLLLGASFLVAVQAFATAYLLPAGAAYVLFSVVLLHRILTRGTGPDERETPDG